MAAKQLTMDELTAGLDQIRQSPADDGEVRMIMRRPAVNERELLEEGQLDLAQGLVGDDWSTRGSQMTPPREPNPEPHLTLMTARVAELVSGDRERWALAGDQLYVDFDIGMDNAPAGTQLSIGSAVIEVTAEPHTGCKKFVERFGMPAMEFVNSPEGKRMCLRGINTKVVTAGTIRRGDSVKKV